MKRTTPNTRVSLVAVLAAALLVPVMAGPTLEQGGDQFLDGIGETALAARYLFNGNAEDLSRNHFHATLRGNGAVFIEDARFGRVLELTGAGSHVALPGNALAGEDAVSVTAWLYLPTGASGPVFDFGQGPSSRVFAGVAAGSAFTAGFASGSAQGATSATPVPVNQWMHVAVVLDPANRTLTTYVDGAKGGAATDVGIKAEEVLGQAETATSRLYLGRQQEDDVPTLHGRLRDVRLYRVALTAAQVTAIHAGGSGRAGGRRGEPAPVISTAAIPRESPLVARLERIPDIQVETTVGHLPRLPREIPAVYRNGAPGPDVRVIWPAPKDNSPVAAAGTYTVTGRVPGTAFEPKAVVAVKPAGRAMPAPARTVEAFPLGRVILSRDTQGRDTPFIRNRDKFVKALAATNPDSFLYNFRDAFGQPQPANATPLSGWDNQTTRLRGHASGHYLTAIAQAYASATYDEALRATFLQKMNYLIDTLHDLARLSGRPSTPGGPSNADPTRVPPGPGRSGYDSNLRAGAIRTDYWNWGTGFISGYPPDQFIMLELGATYGTQDTQIWAPYYTLHKILAGLLDCYEVGGNPKALEVARGMGAWVYARLKAVPPETRISMWNRYIAGEYGGMNEVLARLSRLTREPMFLECAKLFDNTTLFFGNAAHDHGLAANVDTIRGKHANQHIPQITGALETFRGTGELPYYRIADNFWDIATGGYMYAIGGVAGARNPNNAECFTIEPDSLWEHGFANGGQNETCCTYNLLKLDRQLFMYDQTAKYMDHYELGLYNHILASVAEENPGNTYHVPLTPGAQKRFTNADMNGFTCCNGTALESHTKQQDSIYFRSADDRTLYVNLFVPSRLDWTERKVVVTQHTDFPYADTTRLVVTGSGAFDMKIRVPRWATKGFFVKINGRDERLNVAPGTYVTLRRTWRPNDTVEVRIPFVFHLAPVMDQPNVAGLYYGPVLLAAEESAQRNDWRPITLDGGDIAKSVSGDPGTLRFTIDGVTFKPFFETYGRHSVYLHVTLK